MSPKFPSQSQLILPLLEAIDEAGGAAPPAEVYDVVAEKVSLDPDLRQIVVDAGSAKSVNAWERHVRFARQRAVFRGLLENSPERRRRNMWELSDRGREGLHNCKSGVVVTVYETEMGEALWATCESAVSLIADGSIDLILTSPPYPLVTKKTYGNFQVAEHIDWLVECARAWRDKLADTGSLVLNMADVWTPGSPTMSLYQERLLVKLVDELGYHLAEKLFWENPAKMPVPAEWVTVRRIRLTPSVEQIWWLSRAEHPKANNRNVLRPYSESMRARIGAGGERGAKRPSGHQIAAGAFASDNGGSIAHNLLTLSNTASNDPYQKKCREAALPPHPARFPAGLPNFFIRLLTDPGDVVYDPFSGSGQTAAVAEVLGRHWITSERSLTYARGSALRFDHLPSFRGYFDELVEKAA